MTKFEKGDNIIVHKPKDTTQFPIWEKEMDKFDGQILTVRKLDINGMLEGTESEYYVFHPDWCEKVSSSEIPNNHTMKAGIFDEHIRGELDLLENKKLITEQPSSPQPISTEIDWEQRRYELTKEFVVAKIFWIGYEKITNQVITRTIEIADEVIKQLKRQ